MLLRDCVCRATADKPGQPAATAVHVRALFAAGRYCALQSSSLKVSAACWRQLIQIPINMNMQKSIERISFKGCSGVPMESAVTYAAAAWSCMVARSDSTACLLGRAVAGPAAGFRRAGSSGVHPARAGGSSHRCQVCSRVPGAAGLVPAAAGGRQPCLDPHCTRDGHQQYHMLHRWRP